MICFRFEALGLLVSSATLSPTKDRWVWSLVRSGVFSMASTWKSIDDKLLC